MITLTEKEIFDNKYNNYQLCYVEEIPDTYTDLDEESKEIMRSEKYKQFQIEKEKWSKEYFKTHHSMSYEVSQQWNRDHGYNWNYNYKEYPNPEYEKGFTHYLYFTNNLNEQWGDDWDDAPYEYNAEIPYEYKTHIVRVAVNLYYEDCLYDFILKLPKDYGNGNSPFSVDMINAGMIPWIFMCLYEHKIIPNKSISLMGGNTLKDVLTKLDWFNKIVTNINKNKK